MSRSYDAIVLGGGAAGLMCAITAGRRGRRVAVLERADRIGKKILISGGGRCNFTNLHCRPENFMSANPHFCKSALARYTPQDFIALVEKHHIPYHEKTLGQLFCDGSAQEIVAMLESECHSVGVEIFTGALIKEVTHGGQFAVTTERDEFHARALVVATGGLSIPKMGATAFGYELAKQFGLKVRECRPALVPLTFNPDDRKNYSDLAGVSADVIASIGRRSFREKMLITHRGLSGPAILQISSYWDGASPITVDLAPQYDVTCRVRGESSGRELSALKAAFRGVLADRLADCWVERHAPTRWTNAALEEFERGAHAWQVKPAGTEGYDKAEVTAGGIDTGELSAKTMESHKLPGLYFIGEVVDVTGQLGGFNFQWAWASGFAAGEAI
ncbi:MAG TPA: NAD(P)/FAD-dependent oxidoreductase [Candidatus Angelobacter sp.]|nr:NAD(P)/FAD-dependent oxidoreductase [Candidatus Angelobacter sp.]